MSNDTDWHAECLRKGFEYVRESDDHYLIASPAEMVALLRDLLGLDVRAKDARDYGVTVAELQEQVDGLTNTLRAQYDRTETLKESLEGAASSLEFISRLAIGISDYATTKRQAALKGEV